MAGSNLAAPAAALLLFSVLLTSAAASFYPASSAVVALTASNFQNKIKNVGGVWLVEFYAPWCGHCQALKPAWEKAAAALKGIVHVAAVDADEHKSLAGEYGIKGFPTIKLFYSDDKGAIKTVDYQGAREAKDLAAWALDKAKALAMKRLGAKAAGNGGSSGNGRTSGSGAKAGARSSGGGGGSEFYGGSDVIDLDGSNFESEVLDSEDVWMVEFYAPWCGHCKALKSDWKQAAKELKGKAKLGAVDCTQDQATCGQYGVQGYPTIKVFAANKKRPQAYNGERSAAAIVQHATQEWAKNAPPPEVKQLTDQDTFEAQCLGAEEAEGEGVQGRRQLCFVAFLPDIRDSGAAGRNRYINVLKQLTEAYKDRPFGYLWAAAGAQPRLEASFGVGGAGYPALVAFNPKGNGAFSTFKYAFETSHVKGFVESLRKGGEAAAPLAAPLAPLAMTAPWDGKDAPPEVEEEFSLEELNEEL